MAVYSNFVANKEVYSDFSDDPPDIAWPGLEALIDTAAGNV